MTTTNSVVYVVGDVIRFTYNRGSNPGTIRTIKVSEMNARYVVGTPVGTNLVRKYIKSEMRDVMNETVGVPTKDSGNRVVSFQEARVAVAKKLHKLTGEQLAQVYAQLESEGATVEYDGFTGNINVKPVVVEPRFKCTNNKLGWYCDIYNSKSESLRFGMTDKGVAVGTNNNIGPVEMVKAIANHLGLVVIPV